MVFIPFCSSHEYSADRASRTSDCGITRHSEGKSARRGTLLLADWGEANSNNPVSPLPEFPPMLRVCSFESRRAAEMRSLIERHGGMATIAPSLQEIPIEDNADALAFGEQLKQGEIDIVVFLTGVGAQGLLDVLRTRHSLEELQREFGRTTVIVRGPKPVAILRAAGVRVDYRAAEPNTWREVVELLDNTPIPVAGQVVAIQEYGQPQPELTQALQARLATVLPVPVYKWALPEDIGPLEQSIHSTIAREFDVLLFTSAQQAVNVLEVAERMGVKTMWLEAAKECVIGSIGPTATETLTGLGLTPDVEPSHGKMGHLVIETLAFAQSGRLTPDESSAPVRTTQP
jgi:uroporphyrinogen-III synthase